MNKLIFLAIFLMGSFVSATASHQATNVSVSLSPTNAVVGGNVLLEYVFQISAETNAAADTFIITNPFPASPISSILGISVDTNPQWFMKTSTRPASTPFMHGIM